MSLPQRHASASYIRMTPAPWRATTAHRRRDHGVKVSHERYEDDQMYVVRPTTHPAPHTFSCPSANHDRRYEDHVRPIYEPERRPSGYDRDLAEWILPRHAKKNTH